MKDHQKIPDTSVGWVVKPVDCPQQKNGNDCGVFAIIFAEAAMSVDHPAMLSFEFNQDNIPAIRKYICHRILVTPVTTERKTNERMNKTTSPREKGLCQF